MSSFAPLCLARTLYLSFDPRAGTGTRYLRSGKPCCTSRWDNGVEHGLCVWLGADGRATSVDFFCQDEKIDEARLAALTEAVVEMQAAVR
eukprot:SAG22_NODE_1133_length_5415_cov_2.124153_4_plen_90_part_00